MIPNRNPGRASRKRNVGAVLFGLSTSLVLACAASPLVEPKTGPGTPYPCGHVTDVTCSVEPLACCVQHSVCGDGTFRTRCPKDSCCNLGGDVDEVGMRRPTPQWSPHPSTVR